MKAVLIHARNVVLLCLEIALAPVVSVITYPARARRRRESIEQLRRAVAESMAREAGEINPPK